MSADICIVGAGVAGITLAHQLMAEGLDIILLEAGGEQYSEESQQYYRAQSFPQLFPKPEVARLRMLGGSSNHWDNSTERFDAIDFERRPWVNHSGWPISFSDVASYYTEAEQYCGVGQDGYSVERWLRRQEFSDICEGSNNLEAALIKKALPPTRFYFKYGEALEQASSLRIISHAALTDLDFDTEKQLVKSVTFQANPAVKHQVAAKLVVFGMGGIENARMLLLANEKYANALGNQYDNVGRYFMEHPVIRAAHLYTIDRKKLPSAYDGVYDSGRFLRLRLKLREKALYDHQTNNLRLILQTQSERVLSHGIASSHIMIDKLSSMEWPDNFGAHLSQILGDIDMVADALSRRAFGKVLVDSSDDFSGYQMLAMIEQTPDPENRIQLGQEPDALGMKRIEVKWRVTESDQAQAWKALELLASDAGVSRWGRVRLLPERDSRIWAGQMGYSGHHMGTTKMSASERNGVVDSECRVFGTKNLFVAGSSVFPTGGHVPPTLTITAMAIRLAKTLRKAS